MQTKDKWHNGRDGYHSDQRLWLFNTMMLGIKGYQREQEEEDESEK